MMSSTNIVIDLNGIAFAVYHKAFGNGSKFAKNLLIHQMIVTLNAVDKQFNPDGIIIATDSPYVWRRDIYPQYKANRKANRDPNYDAIKDAISDTKNFFNQCTSIPVVAVDRCEADDIIAGVVELKEELANEDELIIISADKDFIQLIRPGVRLYSPTQKVERECEDPKYALFEKCIRGDLGDNIFSAYPRVRSTKLKAAYNNPIDMANLLNEQVRGMKVDVTYQLNRNLIDLSRQPKEIKEAVNEKLKEAMNGYATYKQVGCLKFFGEHELVNLASELPAMKRMFKKTFNLNNSILNSKEGVTRLCSM